MDQDHERAFLYYRSPEDIRNQEFAHRMRGIDADEVYEFLDLLADQVSSSEVERTEHLREKERLSRENEQLRAEVARLRGELGSAREQPAATQAHGDAHAQAAALLAQAQQVADQLVEEAVRHARDLMSSARHPEQPVETTWPRTERPQVTEERRPSGSGYGESVPDQPSGGVERTFTYRRRTWA